MDQVYGFYNNNASSKINIKAHFEEFSNVIKAHKDTLSMNQEKSQTDDCHRSILDTMNVNLERDDINVLMEYCSIDNLTVPGEMAKLENYPQMRRKHVFKATEIPNDINLETIRELKKRSSDTNIKTYLKYKSEYLISYEKVEQFGNLAIPGESFIVYFRVYEPFLSHPSEFPDKQKMQKLRVNCVIGILGCQTLAQLRDKITCVSDLSISKEVSNDPENVVGPLAKNVYKSGFFYIEDTFYNDYRDPTNVDNSEVIIEWAKTRQLGPFQTASMEDTRVDTLSMRFGFPWVYQHQGNCEHLIVATDARLVNSDDELLISAYPRIQRVRPRGTKYCMMCGIFCVRWIVTDSDRVPHNTCYFCDICFKSYNYIDGKKIGNFKAYAYPSNPELVQDSQCNQVDSIFDNT